MRVCLLCGCMGWEIGATDQPLIDKQTETAPLDYSDPSVATAENPLLPNLNQPVHRAPWRIRFVKGVFCVNILAVIPYLLLFWARIPADTAPPSPKLPRLGTKMPYSIQSSENLLNEFGQIAKKKEQAHLSHQRSNVSFYKPFHEASDTVQVHKNRQSFLRLPSESLGGQLPRNNHPHQPQKTPHFIELAVGPLHLKQKKSVLKKRQETALIGTYVGTPVIEENKEMSFDLPVPPFHQQVPSNESLVFVNNTYQQAQQTSQLREEDILDRINKRSNGERLSFSDYSISTPEPSTYEPDHN